MAQHLTDDLRKWFQWMEDYKVKDHRSFGDLPKGAQLRFLNEAVAQGKRYGNISKEGDPLSVRK